MTVNGTLSPKQQQFLLALLSGQHVEEAARAAHVSVRTAFRWQKLPDFQRELEEAKEETFNKQLGYLKDGVATALRTLLRNMGERVPPAVQVRAAAVWLENAIAIYKTEQLELALADIEDLLEKGGFHVPTY